jgi:hypothetical protein
VTLKNSGLSLVELADKQRAALLKTTGKGKYGSKRCEVDGEHFHSKAEAKRWLVLRDMQRRGQITGLLRQTKYPIVVGGIHCADYYADFEYHKNGRLIIEDVKGVSTQVFRLKKRLVEAIHRVRITVVPA